MSNEQQNGTIDQSIPHWAPILGKWSISANAQTFRGEGRAAIAHGQSFPIGLAVTNVEMQTGSCRVTIRFTAAIKKDDHQAAGIVLGYHSPEQHYICAQLAADQHSYSLSEYVSGFGWRPLISTGELENLVSDRAYDLQVNLVGQELKVLVDSVPVIQHLLAHPIEGRQVGLIAAGSHDVLFSNFGTTTGRPKAFVVMKFSEPYNTFYDEVIQRQAKEAGYDVLRIDEKAGPGIIFQDIQREIQQAELVIAEITPANPNVFYELGYAHALGKPTILLAQRDTQLPFDISSFRVVFYNDTIGGKTEVERNLRKHLDAIGGR